MPGSRFAALALSIGLAAVSGAVFPQGSATPGQCPQPRFTGRAPAEYYDRVNPLPDTAENQAAGERLFAGNSGTEACAICHGRSGDGKGPLASQYNPPPRNFSCAKTIKDVPDGQLFW